MKHFTQPQLSPELIRTKEELQFMIENEAAQEKDYLSLIAKKKPSLHKEIISQIVSRNKIKHKLPFWYAHPDIIYPSNISLEQCSSELTAKFKASLFKGKQFIDMTSGFGVDAFYFAHQFEEGYLIEQNEALSKISAHNFALLHQQNMHICHGMNAVDFIKSSKLQVELIYIDPARRDQHGEKVVRLTDTEPDVVYLMPDIMDHCQHLLVKTSPLLDISLTCETLQHVKTVYIVDVNNDCKELLFHIEKNHQGDYQLQAVHLKNNSQQIFRFLHLDEGRTSVQHSAVEEFVYEPYAAILKAGAFKQVAHQFGLNKLHLHTHLYTSNRLIDNFAGRRFLLLAKCPVNKKALEQILPSMKANLSIRNFPGSVEGLKKKLGLKDGGDQYLFAITNHLDQKELLLTKKI